MHQIHLFGITKIYLKSCDRYSGSISLVKKNQHPSVYVRKQVCAIHNQLVFRHSKCIYMYKNNITHSNILEWKMSIIEELLLDASMQVKQFNLYVQR